DLEPDGGSLLRVARTDGAVADLVVDDPGRALALEPEAGHRLRGEEQPFARVALGVAGELALLELDDRVVRRGEAEVAAQALPDADAVAADRDRRRAAALEGDRHLDRAATGVVDRVVQYLGRRVGEAARRLRVERADARDLRGDPFPDLVLVEPRAREA